MEHAANATRRPAPFTSIGLRRLFYLVSPQESTYERVDDVPDFAQEVRAISKLFA